MSTESVLAFVGGPVEPRSIFEAWREILFAAVMSVVGGMVLCWALRRAVLSDEAETGPAADEVGEGRGERSANREPGRPGADNGP